MREENQTHGQVTENQSAVVDTDVDALTRQISIDSTPPLLSHGTQSPANETGSKIPHQPSPTSTATGMTSSKLRNLSNKVENARSHRDFLAACNREQLLPRGFRLKWSSHYNNDNMTADILTKASGDLVKACLRLAVKKLAALELTFESGWEELSVSLAAADLDRLSIQLSKDRLKIRSRLQRTKHRKLVELRKRQHAGDDIGGLTGTGAVKGEVLLDAAMSVDLHDGVEVVAATVGGVDRKVHNSGTGSCSEGHKRCADLVVDREDGKIRTPVRSVTADSEEIGRRTCHGIGTDYR